MEDINSWEHCAHLCQETDECEYWSYFTESFVVNSMVGQCDLQKSDEGHREASGVISGSAECGECKHKLGTWKDLNYIYRDNNNTTTTNCSSTAEQDLWKL